MSNIDSSIKRIGVALAASLALFASACGPGTVPIVPAGAPESVRFPAYGNEPYSVSIPSDAAGKTEPGCKLPCKLQLPSGTTSFEFTAPDGNSIDGMAVVPKAPTDVTPHEKSKFLLIGGGVISLAGLALVTPIMFDGATPNGGTNKTDLILGAVGIPTLILGTVLMAVSGSDGVTAKPAASN